MKHIFLCECICGGDVISRHNGSIGFCEDCGRCYKEDIDDCEEV